MRIAGTGDKGGEEGWFRMPDLHSIKFKVKPLIGFIAEFPHSTLTFSFSFRKKGQRKAPHAWLMNMALKRSTDVLLSCWVCSQEGRNHCSKAGVNAPLLQRQLSLKLENQGHWYLQGNKDIIITTPNWPVTFHSSGLPYSLRWHQPRSSHTELCVPDRSDGGATHSCTLWKCS